MDIDKSNEKIIDSLTDYLERVHLDSVMRLMPSSTFFLSLDDPEISEIFTLTPDAFADLVRTAIIKILSNYDDSNPVEKIAASFSELKIRLSSQKTDVLSQIRPESINSPVSVRAIISGLNEKKSFIKRAHLECPNGHDEGSMNVEVDAKRQFPAVKCNSCDSLLYVDPDSSQHEYIQFGTIQEPPEESKKGNPTEFDVVFIGDQTKDISVGDRKELVGVLRAIFNKKENVHDLLVDVISVTDTEGKQELMPSPEEVKAYKEQALKPNFLETLASSFAPEILPNDLLIGVKKSILLGLVGGVKTDTKRGDINILLLGDPSVAKSSMLKFANKIVRKSMYTSGRGASAAGITIGIVKRPNGTSIAQAGVLPLCNKGYAFIDELDKMSPIDRTGLHEAMEQQTVSISKAGISMTLPAETAVIAAANPKGGRWNVDMQVLDNVNLIPTLLSRFDLKWCIRDIVSSQDERIANHILKEFTDGTGGKFDSDDLTKILNHTRRIRPKITRDAAEILTDFYIQLRKKSVDNEQVIIDTRQLESMIRFSQSHAKIHFRDEVKIEDAHAVIALFKLALESFPNFTIDGEVIQSNFERSTKEHREQMFWEVWRKCENSDGYIDMDTFMSTLTELDKSQKHWSPSSAETYFNKLHKEGVIFFNRNGKWKKV